MIKPERLRAGDTIATISPSWGCAGVPRVKWKYELGCRRLEELGLKVVAAPNSMKGTRYLQENPEARAQDIMWAFSNPEIKAILCNIGGNDSVKLLPYLDAEVIKRNPKIFCGYSDAMTIHLYLYKLGLMSYYGDNLLTVVAEQNGWHDYSRESFIKTFFCNKRIGRIEPAKEWSHSKNNHTNPMYRKQYMQSFDYEVIQGDGQVTGRLIGGHGDLLEIGKDAAIKLVEKDFEGAILFFEDIEEVCTLEYIEDFFDKLGRSWILKRLNGIIIGRMKIGETGKVLADCIKKVVAEKYSVPTIPIIYGLNIGHISPICILPYGAQTQISVVAKTASFELCESGVV